MKMNPEIKEKWLAALKSGEYEHGIGALRQEGVWGDTYCCLGVLTDLYIKEEGGQWERGATTEGYWSFDRTCGTLPEPVRAWSGVTSHGGFNGNGEFLTEVNDKSDSFAEVIKIIEEFL